MPVAPRGFTESDALDVMGLANPLGFLAGAITRVPTAAKQVIESGRRSFRGDAVLPLWMSQAKASGESVSKLRDRLISQGKVAAENQIRDMRNIQRLTKEVGPDEASRIRRNLADSPDRLADKARVELGKAAQRFKETGQFTDAPSAFKFDVLDRPEFRALADELGIKF